MYNPFSFLKDKDEVSVDVVKDAMESKAPVTLVDVRNPDEYTEGHIKNSLLLPLPELLGLVSKLPDTSKTLYVYCRRGIRGARAVAELKRVGYTDVHNMTGGIEAWTEKGYFIENGKKNT